MKLKEYFSFFTFYFYLSKNDSKKYHYAADFKKSLTVLCTPLAFFILQIILAIAFDSTKVMIFSIIYVFLIPFTLYMVLTTRNEEYRIKQEQEELRREQERKVFEAELKRRYEERRKRMEEEFQRRREESKKRSQVKSFSYYQILGVNENASLNEVKKAYRELAKKYHPDVLGGDPVKFMRIKEAYDKIMKKVL